MLLAHLTQGEFITTSPQRVNGFILPNPHLSDLRSMFMDFFNWSNLDSTHFIIVTKPSQSVIETEFLFFCT